MDPLACLLNVYLDISNGDYDDARNGLRDYWQWRERGGYEPQNLQGMFWSKVCKQVIDYNLPGDKFAWACERRLYDAVTWSV